MLVLVGCLLEGVGRGEWIREAWMEGQLKENFQLLWAEAKGKDVNFWHADHQNFSSVFKKAVSNDSYD